MKIKHLLSVLACFSLIAIASLTVAAQVGRLEGDVVTSMRMVVSALGARPREVTGLEKVAAGKVLNAETVEAIAERAYQQAHPLENIIVDADWRRAMVPVYVKRALAELE